MGIQAPSTPDAPPMHRQCDVLLGPLERLAILSMGACHLQVGAGGRCIEGKGRGREQLGAGAWR